MGAACIVPHPSALFPGPRSLLASPVTRCHSFCRNPGGGKANERGQIPTTDPSKPPEKSLYKISPACCPCTSCWESSTCEYQLGILPRRKAAVVGIAVLSSFECLDVSLPSSFSLALLLSCGAPLPLGEETHLLES